MHTLRVECVRDAATLESLKDDFARLSGGAFMQSLAWLVPWWEAYCDNHKLHVLVGYRDAEVCGIFPLAETSNAITGRSLVFMGSGKVCSDNLGILASEVDAEAVAIAFADWLVCSPECCQWDQLNLDGIRDSNLAMQHFAIAIEAAAKSQIERKTSPNCWSASLAGGLEAYKSLLTKRAKKIVREAEEGIDSGKGRFEIATTRNEATEFMREIERMHQARWQERGIDGCFSTQEFSRFLHGTVDRMWDEPWIAQGENLIDDQQQVLNRQRVLVGLLRIDAVVAAGAICFRERDAIAMYLVGMNPEFAKERPGWMLNTCFIRHAIALGCDRLDFLRGDEEYKERLGGVPTAQNRWLLPSRRLTSQIRNAAYRTAVVVKDWWNDRHPFLVAKP
jgi:CelD/BcsL family acetyltransferase involved in cellulose biosynthesis